MNKSKWRLEIIKIFLDVTVVNDTRPTIRRLIVSLTEGANMFLLYGVVLLSLICPRGTG